MTRKKTLNQKLLDQNKTFNNHMNKHVEEYAQYLIQYVEKHIMFCSMTSGDDGFYLVIDCWNIRDVVCDGFSVPWLLRTKLSEYFLDQQCMDGTIEVYRDEEEEKCQITIDIYVVC